MTDYRIERDTMGEVRVPADALWRAQTQRAVENFPISGRGLEPSHIRALAQIKAAAAAVNAELGVLDPGLAASIEAAAVQVASGACDAQFPIDTFQTGSGTSSNMNANEVIASLAAQSTGVAVHPNDHVNASQSSNDVFPSSIHLADGVDQSRLDRRTADREVLHRALGLRPPQRVARHLDLAHRVVLGPVIGLFIAHTSNLA